MDLERFPQVFTPLGNFSVRGVVCGEWHSPRITVGAVQTSRRRPAAVRVAPARVHELVAELLSYDVHTVRVLLFASGGLDVVQAAALGVHAIVRGLADAMGLDPKHAIEQVDRLLSNRGVTVRSWIE